MESNPGAVIFPATWSPSLDYLTSPTPENSCVKQETIIPALHGVCDDGISGTHKVPNMHIGTPLQVTKCMLSYSSC